MGIAKNYNPLDIEKKWYDTWLENGYFHSEPDEREPYTVVIPPPNVTGVLHMGHMLNNTLQDVLVRKARMEGKNACWVPGTDHASIATEAKVVAKLKEEGIDKSTLSREAFLEHAWEWKEKHGGIILEQLKYLGASCDWKRTKFTMDPEMSESVIRVFVDLFNKGLIYRGIRMVNWDPAALTAVSDEEVVYKEVQSQLYHLQYPVVGEDGNFVTIATTRPETILGDTAVCVNPDDKRYTHLHGKKVRIPLLDKEIPVITDAYVDMEFGTGCLKVTPAHDVNDYEIGIRHNLDVVDIFNDNGTLNEAAQLYIGKDRFEVRREIVKHLDETGFLVQREDYVNKVGFSERTDAVIEPKLSMQWFLSMKDMVTPALHAVLEDQVQLHPPKFKNVYRHWMENVRDWCLSRQLWWGQRIPAYYIKDTNAYVVATSEQEALVLAKEKTGDDALTLEDLQQDEDVVDTWFSSWLWPITVFDGILKPDNKDIQYYYPTNDLVTAPEILFFWVARMIIAGYTYKEDKPFNNVYLTGIVRDKQRRKMSKSLGNSPDCIELIRQYGADGVRVGMLLCSPAGNDLLFDEALPEQGRNFANKIWNAFRLVKSWEIDANKETPQDCLLAVNWMNHKTNEAIEQLDKAYEQYRISEALMILYRLSWDEFSSWFLEMIKPAYQQPIDQKTYEAAAGIFERLLKLLHPFMPFISEEIYQQLQARQSDDHIMVAAYPQSDGFDPALLTMMDSVKEVVTGVRNLRKEQHVPMKNRLSLAVFNTHEYAVISPYSAVVEKLANVSPVTVEAEKKGGVRTFIVDTIEFGLDFGEAVNPEEEMGKIQEELKYTKGFLQSVNKKLENERFVSNAPEKVIGIEKKKQADARKKIESLEKRLAELKA